MDFSQSEMKDIAYLAGCLTEAGILKFNEIFKPIRKQQNLLELVEIMIHEGTKAGSSRNEPQLSLA